MKASDDDDDGTAAQYKIVRRGQTLNVKDGERHLSLVSEEGPLYPIDNIWVVGICTAPGRHKVSCEGSVP